ncbi:NAD(P)-dependent oxidoreductase [Sphaerisporangium sp. NBC_01403]|uniref:NAD-dependent epimerase/dehydratase family protein n=1 Tax=Sphaerisporangium sp. NBC_01403 TaxID=2903599 RepID=UPI00324DF6FD
MILVTGGLGFIGAHATRALLDLGERCVIAGRRVEAPPGVLADSGDRAVIERMDCTDLDSVLDVGRRHQITGIVHLASASMGGAPLNELRTNTQALFTMLHAAQAWGVSRVVQASTIGVYAGVITGTYREDTALPIPSFHAIPAYKKSAEIIASAVAAGTGLDIVSVRIGAIWGPLGRASSPFFGAPQLVHAAVARRDAGAEAPARPLYADDAIDMCYARDCGRAIALLQTAGRLNHQTYNVGSGRTTTNREVADALIRAVPGTTPDLVEGSSPHTPAGDAHLDISRLRADTGFAPQFDLDRGVADYVHWLRDGHSR